MHCLEINLELSQGSIFFDERRYGAAGVEALQAGERIAEEVEMNGSVTYEMIAQDNVDAVNTHTRPDRHQDGVAIPGAGGAQLRTRLGNRKADIWRSRRAGYVPWPECSSRPGIGLRAIGLIRRNFRQSSKMRTPIRLSWDDQDYARHRLSHAVYPWKDFYRWTGSETSLAALLRDNALFFPVPRRVLPAGVYDEMVQALTNAGVREKGRWGR